MEKYSILYERICDIVDKLTNDIINVKEVLEKVPDAKRTPFVHIRQGNVNCFEKLYGVHGKVLEDITGTGTCPSEAVLEPEYAFKSHHEKLEWFKEEYKVASLSLFTAHLVDILHHGYVVHKFTGFIQHGLFYFNFMNNVNVSSLDLFMFLFIGYMDWCFDEKWIKQSHLTKVLDLFIEDVHIPVSVIQEGDAKFSVCEDLNTFHAVARLLQIKIGVYKDVLVRVISLEKIQKQMIKSTCIDPEQVLKNRFLINSHLIFILRYTQILSDNNNPVNLLDFLNIPENGRYLDILITAGLFGVTGDDVYDIQEDIKQGSITYLSHIFYTHGYTTYCRICNDTLVYFLVSFQNFFTHAKQKIDKNPQHMERLITCYSIFRRICSETAIIALSPNPIV